MGGETAQGGRYIVEPALGQVLHNLSQYRIDGIIELMGREVTRCLSQQPCYQFIEDEIDRMGAFALRAGLKLQKITNDAGEQITAVEVVLKILFYGLQLGSTDTTFAFFKVLDELVARLLTD